MKPIVKDYLMLYKTSIDLAHIRSLLPGAECLDVADLDNTELIERLKKHKRIKEITVIPIFYRSEQSNAQELKALGNNNGLFVYVPSYIYLYNNCETLDQAIQSYSFERIQTALYDILFDAENTRLDVGTAAIDLFINHALSNRYEPIKTGFNNLDKALSGGFLNGTLVTLGGAPGVGKTSYIQMLFEQMALNGNTVLYINLEMHKDILLARSLSRLAKRNYHKKINPIDILRLSEQSNDFKETVQIVATEYKKRIAPNFCYNPRSLSDNNIDTIINVMELETDRLQRQGKTTPIVCIDYLHLVDGKSTDEKQAIKEIILKLKQFAIKHNTLILCIVAHGRDSSKSGVSTMFDSRDSSNIEYTADIMLTMNHRLVEDQEEISPEDKALLHTDEKRYTANVIKQLKEKYRIIGDDIPQELNEVSITIQKGRIGAISGTRIDYLFDGAHSEFIEI